jgi:hypothetical protein
MELAEHIYVTLLREEYCASKAAGTAPDDYDFKSLARYALNAAQVFQEVSKQLPRVGRGEDDDFS